MKRPCTWWWDRFVGLLVLTSMLLVVAACGSASVAATPPQDTSVGEALRRDAQQYAEDVGVSFDEAVRRLGYQDGIGELNAALSANEQDTFAGLWIQHEPDYRVIVQFTRRGKRTIRPYIKGKPFAHLVEVQQGRFTQQELKAAMDQAVHELAKLDFAVSVSLSVPNNRVEISVSDPVWFKAELLRVGAQLPEGAELVVVEGGSTAEDKNLLITPPVPGIAFPRQKPVEGMRMSMQAELIGQLFLDPDDGCLRVESLYDGELLLPIWPPEFTLRVEGDEALVIDGERQVVARAGDEVYMGGGHGSVTDEWVLGQIPQACRGAYWIVGTGVRPNLNRDSELFSLDVISTTERSLLFIRAKPVLDEWTLEDGTLAGTLVLYDYQRCLRVENAPINYLPLWPPDYQVRLEGGEVEVVDSSGQVVARVGERVSFDGAKGPTQWDDERYRQLHHDLPGDCNGPYWIIGER